MNETFDEATIKQYSAPHLSAPDSTRSFKHPHYLPHPHPSTDQPTNPPTPDPDLLKTHVMSPPPQRIETIPQAKAASRRRRTHPTPQQTRRAEREAELLARAETLRQQERRRGRAREKRAEKARQGARLVARSASQTFLSFAAAKGADGDVITDGDGAVWSDIVGVETGGTDGGQCLDGTRGREEEDLARGLSTQDVCLTRVDLEELGIGEGMLVEGDGIEETRTDCEACEGEMGVRLMPPPKPPSRPKAPRGQDAIGPDGDEFCAGDFELSSQDCREIDIVR